MATDPAAALRARLAEIAAEIAALERERERCEVAIEALGLTPAPRATTMVAMLPDTSARRIPGRVPRQDHPLTRALAERNVPLAEWCRANGIRRDSVAHAMAGRRAMPRAWAELAERDLGVPLSAWTLTPQK